MRYEKAFAIIRRFQEVPPSEGGIPGAGLAFCPGPHRGRDGLATAFARNKDPFPATGR